MKKIYFLFVLIALISCGHSKTPAELAEESLDRKMKELEQKHMSHEQYIDSLVNVATGLNGTTLRTNRQHALDILRTEYPEMNEKWDAVQKSIDNLELY